jgi:tetratricopeptide (TPR) repeat protein
MKRITTSKLLVLLPAIMGTGVAYATYSSYDEAFQAARVKYMNGDYAAARKDMTEALSLARTPDEKVSALFRIAQAFKDEKKYVEARAEWGKILKIEDTAASDQLKAQFAIAGTYLDEKNYVQARTKLTEILTSADADTSLKMATRLAIAGSYEAEKKFSLARVEYAEIVECKDADVNTKAYAQAQLGQTYFIEKDFAGARTAWQKIAAMENAAPSLVLTARLGVADTYRLQNNDVEAEREFTAARVLGMKVAQSFLEKKDYPLAIAAFNQVLSMGQPPQLLTLTLHLLIGQTHSSQNNFAQARAEFAKVLTQMDDADASAAEQAGLLAQRAQLAIAQSYLSENNYDQARLEYEKVLKIEGVNAAFRVAAERQLKLIAGKVG